MNRKGFASVIIILIVVAFLIAGGTWYYFAHRANVTSPSIVQRSQPTSAQSTTISTTPTFFSTSILGFYAEPNSANSTDIYVEGSNTDNRFTAANPSGTDGQSIKMLYAAIPGDADQFDNSVGEIINDTFYATQPSVNAATSSRYPPQTELWKYSTSGSSTLIYSLPTGSTSSIMDFAVSLDQKYIGLFDGYNLSIIDRNGNLVHSFSPTDLHICTYCGGGGAYLLGWGSRYLWLEFDEPGALDGFTVIDSQNMTAMYYPWNFKDVPPNVGLLSLNFDNAEIALNNVPFNGPDSSGGMPSTITLYVVNVLNGAEEIIATTTPKIFMSASGTVFSPSWINEDTVEYALPDGALIKKTIPTETL